MIDIFSHIIRQQLLRRTQRMMLENGSRKWCHLHQRQSRCFPNKKDNREHAWALLDKPSLYVRANTTTYAVSHTIVATDQSACQKYDVIDHGNLARNHPTTVCATNANQHEHAAAHGRYVTDCPIRRACRVQYRQSLMNRRKSNYSKPSELPTPMQWLDTLVAIMRFVLNSKSKDGVHVRYRRTRQAYYVD